MKKIMLLTAAALLLTAPINAQNNYVDERGRTVETIVADVLSQMPSQSESQWQSDMSDLVQAAPASIVSLAAFLSDEGAKTPAEYALKGVSDFVSDGKTPSSKVREGLVQAIGESSDPLQKAFLVSILAPIATSQETALLQSLAGDDICGAYAVAALERLGVLKHPQPGELAVGGIPYLKCAAAVKSIDNGSEKNAVKTVKKALKSGDRALRTAVLNAATDRFGAQALVPTVTKIYGKLSPEECADVLYWAGDNGISEMMPQVSAALADNPETSDAAYYAAARIGGDQAITALLSRVGTKDRDKALTALKSVHGDVEGAVLQMVGDENTPPETLSALLRLAGQKKMHSLFGQAVKYCSADRDLKYAAMEALAGTCGPDDAAQIAGMMEKAPAEDLPALQKALWQSLHTLPAGQETAVIKGFMESSRDKDIYFPVMTEACTDASISTLRWYYQKQDNQAARKALLNVKNISVVPDLQQAAKEGGDMADTYIRRYLDLQVPETDHALKRAGIQLAIDLTADQSVKARAIRGLGEMYDPVSFSLAGSFLDDDSPKIRYTAAKSVRDIAAHSADIRAEELVPVLSKASAIFAANGTADDEYAVKQIDKIIQNAAPVPLSKLTPQEEAEGFEMLFDGSDLSKWHGNLDGYIPVNGAIYVSAGFGSDGNLYTNKEYRNFVFRFEFSFLRRGINNGVGIRTRDGVDAAYDGMCEVQILDHDAPNYGRMRPFQLHGSAYGLVPAKRIKHKDLGEWGEEEIRVEGDHIRVTVNGEVVMDANLREACQGHNVAPDGSKNNPYTADHHNHPGMFNERGVVSFCGHGEGLKIRNVRILELPD